MTQAEIHRDILGCYTEAEPGKKAAMTRASAARVLAEPGLLAGLCAAVQRDGGALPAAPGRPSRPALVAPRQLPKRGLGDDAGRAALVHAVAHIELNAINLALDAVLRFPGLPEQYYADWLSVADEESRHFALMRERLQALGCDYGALPAHDGLWEMARQTAADPLRRMALVPRVLEARGLDVTPGMIERLRAVGDHDTADRLGIILREEVGHVAIGSRWFRWLCAERGLEPEATYLALIRQHFRGKVRCPLNFQDRRRAGFGQAELDGLMALCGGAGDPAQPPARSKAAGPKRP